MKKQNLSGQEFGAWLVIRPRDFTDEKYRQYYVCLCRKCRNLYYVRSDNLTSGRSTQCACCALKWKSHKRKANDE